jgi:hypothetical protein
MKRTNTALLSIATVVATTAIAAGPAAALHGNSTPVRSSDTGASVTQSHQAGNSSINAILGSSRPDRAAQPVAASGFRSVNSIVGTQPVPEQTTSVVRESSGFDWGDASIGAMVALFLVLISVVTVRELRRHGRVVVESRA